MAIQVSGTSGVGALGGRVRRASSRIWRAASSPMRAWISSIGTSSTTRPLHSIAKVLLADGEPLLVLGEPVEQDALDQRTDGAIVTLRVLRHQPFRRDAEV